MDSYSYNSYARYYDKNFPSDFQKSCNESAALREDYQLFFNRRFPLKVETETETKIDVLDIGIDSGLHSGLHSSINLSTKVD